jgi:hypothetical protein
MPSCLFPYRPLSLLLLGACFARRFRGFGRASRARVPASKRASRATLMVTPVTMSQLFLPVGRGCCFLLHVA